MDFGKLAGVKPVLASAMEKDLALFAKSAWPVLHRGTKLEWNWHLDLLCEYLMAVKRGDIRRLIINVPPRTLKTTVASICFPVWTWLTAPETAFLAASYELDLASSHNLSRRRLISSAWFQSLFREKFELSADRNLAEEFTNDKGGAMLSASVNSRAQGRGGDICICDDPLSADNAYSDVLRNETNQWFVHQLPQRLNQPATSPIVVIMQRLHTDDPTGFLLEQSDDWLHLKLPLIAEEPERWVGPISGKVWTRETGENLFPKRFPERVVRERQRSRLVFSGQFQQSPSPAEGNLVRVADICYFGGKDPVTGERDPELPASFDQKLISCDASFKDKATSDYVAIATIGVKGGKRYLLHMVNAHLDLDGTEAAILRQHELYGPIDATLVEDKALGPAVVGHLQQKISGVIGVNPQGGKLARMVMTAPSFQAHDWMIDRNAAWTNSFVEQISTFPVGRHDDMVDATTQAQAWLQEHAHGLTYVDWIKDFAAGVVKFVTPPKPKPKPVPTIVLPSLACPKCGDKRTEIYGSGPNAKIHCLVCGAFSDRTRSVFACPKCGCGSNVIASGRRCTQCGFQFYLPGTEPRAPYRPSRKNLPLDRGGYGGFGRVG